MLASALFAGDDLLERIAVDAGRARISTSQNQRHPAVRKVQQALLLWDDAALPRFGADGDYGSETAAAVRRFKIDYMRVDGTVYDDVGPLTVRWLDRIAYSDEQHASFAADMMFPPLTEPMPGLDIIAPDGFAVPVPRRILRRNGTYRELDRATPSIFIDGNHYVVVINNLDPDTYPNVGPVASAAARGAAARAMDNALRRAPDAARRVISFGVGRIAGGVVSIIGSVLYPAPVIDEIHWSAEVDGRPVKYVVLTN
jgi:peptidoglycan hydrolase-like protein with peptidoglycan-binding domain